MEDTDASLVCIILRAEEQSMQMSPIYFGNVKSSRWIGFKRDITVASDLLYYYVQMELVHVSLHFYLSFIYFSAVCTITSTTV